MKEKMQKDKELEQEFREYFDGNAAPQCDLTYAKRALVSERSQTKKPRKWIAAVVSACASAVAVLVLCLTLIPNLIISSRSFTLENTVQNAVGSAQVRESYAAQTQPFASFERADNASCNYALVENKGKTVMLRADVSYYSTAMRFEATVYIDVSGGKYRAEEFKGFADLPQAKFGFRYDTSVDGNTGSNFSRIFYAVGGSAYYATLLSDQPQALNFFLEYLRNYF